MEWVVRKKWIKVSCQSVKTGLKKQNEAGVRQSRVLALEELGARGTDLAEMDQVSYFKLRRRERKRKNGSRSHFAPPSRGRLPHFAGKSAQSRTGVMIMRFVSCHC